MAGCHVGAMEARATVTRHRLWTCVTFQLGCPASQSESVQPWRGGCRLTLIMSHAHVKDDETPPRGDAGVRHVLCARQEAAAASVAGLSDPSSRVLQCVPRAISRHFRLPWS